MSLLRAERRRLFKRRFTRLMLVVVVGILATIAIGFVINSHRNGPAERAAAEAQARQQYEQQVQSFRAQCEQLSRDSTVDPKMKEYCEIPEAGPQPEHFQAQWFLPYEFNFRREFGALIMVFSGILALLAYIVGASYVGAEWNSGGMMNLLLWRPRRVPVLLTKLSTLLGGVLAMGVLLGAAWTTAFWLIGRYDGRSDRMTSGAWESFAISGARGIGLALVLGAVGFGLASLGRHTAMALGVAVGVVVVGEIGLRIALGLMQVRMGDRYLLSTYALAWFNKQWKLQDWKSCNFVLGECQPKEMIITWQHSAAVFGIGTAMVLALAVWTMRRRDVT